MKERRALIDAKAELSIRRQCELLAVSRSGWYYEPEGTSAEDLELMRRIDALHLQYPFLGSRGLRKFLALEGHRVNRKAVQRLMRLMGLTSLAPKPPATTEPAPEHTRYPYLLRGLTIDRVNQVWCADIERHEALLNRAVVKGHGRQLVVADWLKLRAA